MEKYKIEYRNYLLSKEWFEIRNNLFKSRGKKCELCSSTTRIEVHHKTYKNIFNEQLEDLQVLCSECHSDIHKVKGTKKPQKEKKTKKKLTPKEKKQIKLRNKMNQSRMEQLRFMEGLV